jgi:hypothetical protein
MDIEVAPIANTIASARLVILGVFILLSLTLIKNGASTAPLGEHVTGKEPGPACIIR